MNSPSPVAYLDRWSLGSALAQGKQNARDLEEKPVASGTRDGNVIQEGPSNRMAGDVWNQGVNGAMAFDLKNRNGVQDAKAFVKLWQSGPFAPVFGENDQSGGVA